MPRPVEGTSPYSPGLDGIRAVAVLGVVAYHLNFGWASGGLLGVGVFFVLSGYLITDLLVAEYERRGGIHLGQFWLRRARRLLPALFVMLFVVVAWATLFNQSQLPDLRSDSLPAIFYVSNWWYIFHHVSYFARFGPPSPLGHLWSLAVEEQFYLFWPLILLGALRWVRDKRVVLAGIVALAAASALEMAVLYSPNNDPTRVYDGTDTRAFALLTGAALAFALPRNRTFWPIGPGARRILEVVGGLAVVGIVALYAGTSEFDPFVYRGGMLLLSVLTAVLIAVCVHPGARLGQVLGVEPLRWVGERSYGMYLWQYPVIVLTTPLNAPPNYLRALLQVAAIFAVSAASWHFIEQPVRHGALGRLWARLRRRGRAQVLPGPAGWAVAGGVMAGAMICVLGLTGVVTGSAAPTDEVKSILPPKHHVVPTTTTTAPAPGATTSAPGVTTTTTPSGQGVTAIGDSIMVDAAPYLQQMLPGIVIDAQVGQQLTQVQAQAAQLRSEGDIGDRLILELGTNGYYSPAQLQGLLSSLGPMKKVVIVNTRVPLPWEQGVNQTIAAVAKTNPNVTVVDWYDASASTPQYFYPDGIHLNPTGAQFYASLLVKALEVPPPPPPPPPTTTTTGAHRGGHRTGGGATGGTGSAPPTTSAPTTTTTAAH